MKLNIKILFALAIVFSHTPQKAKTGTVTATVFTPNKIYMFSDGRAIDADTREILSDTLCKVFMLTRKCVILTGGIKIIGIEDTMTKLFKRNNIIYVNDAVPYIQRFVLNQSQKAELRVHLINHRIFLFICGYDSDGKQRLYYIDSHSKTPFQIIEHKISYEHQDTDVGLMATNSDVGGNLFLDQISLNSKRADYVKRTDYYIRKSFDYTKDSISKIDKSVGGKTFEYLMTKNYCIKVD